MQIHEKYTNANKCNRRRPPCQQPYNSSITQSASVWHICCQSVAVPDFFRHHYRYFFWYQVFSVPLLVPPKNQKILRTGMSNSVCCLDHHLQQIWPGWWWSRNVWRCKYLRHSCFHSAQSKIYALFIDPHWISRPPPSVCCLPESHIVVNGLSDNQTWFFKIRTNSTLS